MYSIKFLLLVLGALALSACSAAAVTDTAEGSPPAESVGEQSLALCASYPVSGAGDGDGSGAPGGGWTGFVTQLRVSPAYDSMLEVTQTKSVGGTTVVGTLNFGAYPGPSNIKFIRAKSPGWVGSLTNRLVNLNRCISGLPGSQTGCGGYTCNEPNGYECLFANGALALTWQDWNTPTNPGGAIIPGNATNFPLGVTGIWGTAPNEPSHFRIFALSSGGAGSYSSRWTFLNGTTCP